MAQSVEVGAAGATWANLAGRVTAFLEPMHTGPAVLAAIGLFFAKQIWIELF